MLSVPYRSSLRETSPALDLQTAASSVRLRAAQSVHSGPIMVVAGLVCGAAFGLAGGGWLSVAWAVLIITTSLINRRVCLRIAKMQSDAPVAQVVSNEQTMWWMTIMNVTAVGLGVWMVSAGGASNEVLLVLTTIQVLYTIGALINASTHPETFIAGVVVNFGLLILYWDVARVSRTCVSRIIDLFGYIVGPGLKGNSTRLQGICEHSL